jgi:D-arabinonate dehydratase
MRITGIRVTRVAVPLQEALGVGIWWNQTREYVLVWIDTDSGVTGLGISYGGYQEGSGRLLEMAINEYLTPALLNRDPRDVEQLWDLMYRSNLPLARRGIIVWAISAIDVALWDLKAKDAGQPLYKLLGGFREAVPYYVTGGYYRKNESADTLAREMEGYRDRNIPAVKLKLGRLSAEADAARAQVCREVLGKGVKLAVDANCGWQNAVTALRALEQMAEVDLWFVEEPVAYDNLRDAAEIARRLSVPIVNGEHSVTRWDVRDLVLAEAADIVQLDATMVGGITEWMRAAHFASCMDRPVVPVWFANLHVHLAAAVSNAFAVEYFPPEEGFFPFERLLRERLEPRDGFLSPPQRPGHGMELDMDAVARFSVK